MIKKIATFMMGIGLIASSSLAFVSADVANSTFKAEGLKYDNSKVSEIG
jgi:hypothetical protein|nr:MAG TPA: hypothetical protein [Caudoviricetes sp.]